MILEAASFLRMKIQEVKNEASILAGSMAG
jgi:hypothetical protein